MAVLQAVTILVLLRVKNIFGDYDSNKNCQLATNRLKEKEGKNVKNLSILGQIIDELMNYSVGS